MSTFNWKRFNLDMLTRALTESIKHGPCRASDACRYTYRGNHCVMGWLFVIEGQASEADLKSFDRLGLTASETLAKVVGVLPSYDEQKLINTLQTKHDSAAHTGYSLGAKYAEALRLSGLDELADHFDD